MLILHVSTYCMLLQLAEKVGIALDLGGADSGSRSARCDQDLFQRL